MFKEWIGSPAVNATTVPVTKARAPKTFLRQTANVMVATRQGSIERRVARALLCSSAQFPQIQAIADSVPLFRLGSGSFTQERKNFDILVSEGSITLNKSSGKGLIKGLLMQQLPGFYHLTMCRICLGALERLY